MRKGQRFTPARLRRWQESGRGTGAGADYKPWHQVTRSDPGSRGRSHIINGRYGRPHDLLSDGEREAFGFATMLPGLTDLWEQHPLAREDQASEFLPAPPAGGTTWSEGTLSIAAALGIKYPVVHKEGDLEPWTLSTDLVLHLQTPTGTPEVLAISVKQAAELENKRKLQLLQIEREYWTRQGIGWLLLTERLYDRGVGRAIRAGLAWTLGQAQSTSRHLELCAALSKRFAGCTLRDVLVLIQDRTGVDQATAQAIFWQSVWRGETPIDLTMPIRAGATFQLLSEAAFWQQNPIAARRSAWMH